MEHKDYYRILSIPRDADSATIKRAYRNLARQYHPDLNGGNPEAEHKFKEISEAYSVLSDAGKRRAYDQHGIDWQQRSEGQDNFNWPGWFGEGSEAAPRPRARTTTEEFEQSLREQPSYSDNRTEQESDRQERGRQERGRQESDRQESDRQESDRVDRQHPFSGLFQQFFHKSDAQRREPSYTSHETSSSRDDQIVPIEISLEEAFRGATRTIQQGTERYEVAIPKGIQAGSHMRITHNSELAHLALLVNIKPHPLLAREGDNLHVKIRVELYTALLGGEIQVPTLEGDLLLIVPPNTQNGRTFRLKGQGMPLLKSPDRRGDLYAEIQVELPVPLTNEERHRFSELRRLRQNPNDLFT
jgi:DnaJ-class molecular chaperone